MIPDLGSDGGEWISPDDFDAIAIHDMAIGFKESSEEINSFRSAWEMTGPHPTAGQITFCWENPTAWETLDGDVDRQWFMEQVVTRTPDIPPIPSMDE
jgi:hypothetical protein